MYEKTAVIFRVPAHNDIAGQKRELMRGDMEKMGIIKTMARAVPALAGEGRSQTYGAASRLGQYPGYDLSLGRRDERGGVLV